MRCNCSTCVHNDGYGGCKDFSSIIIDEYGCCEDLYEDNIGENGEE